MVFLFRGNWVLTVPLFTLIQTEFSLTDIQTPSVTVTQSWTHHVTLSFDAGHVTQTLDLWVRFSQFKLTSCVR